MAESAPKHSREFACTEAQVERRHDEAREKQRRAEQKAGERAARWHAEEMADTQRDAARRREKLAKTVATRVRQLMETQDHPGLSDDVGIARAARHADLSAEAAASNERQVSALGRIRGVGDLPTYTADAAENYGDKGIDEVADLIHRTAQADPEQGMALLEQTVDRLSAAKAERLKATVASLEHDDGPGAIAPHGTQLSAGTDNGGDWDEGLSPYERNKRMFPGSGDEDKPNTLEQLRRNWTDTNTSATRDVPPYKVGDTPPSTDESKANFYVHHLDLDPKLAERIKPDDIETLRLLERFRQLDGEGTKALENHLGKLQECDPQLFNALNGKRAVALANPGLELWSMLDKELNDAIERIKTTEPIKMAFELASDVDSMRKGRVDPVSGISRSVRDSMGGKTQLEHWLESFESELRRRDKWHDQR